MRATTRRATPLTLAVPAALLTAFVLAAPTSAGDWTLRLAPAFMDAYGHDQHVLNIHEVGASTTTTTALSLDTEDGLAFHGELQYTTGGAWTWGLDVTVFYTDQATQDRTAAGSGPDDRVEFEVADRTFVSDDPSEELFFGVLEDTSLQTWTADLYALRTLSENDEGVLMLKLGLRTADFDNDYRAVVGIQREGGRRLDASSNYDRMTGPLIGIAGRITRGRSVFEGSIAQAVLLGSVELSGMAREFTGDLGVAFPVEDPIPTTTSTETFKKVEDVAIPVTDLDLRWTYRITEWLSLGAGVTTSTWWDVPVAPGVIPVEDGFESTHESTIVFLGVSGIAELRF